MPFAPITITKNEIQDLEQCREISIFGIYEREGAVYTRFFEDKKSLETASARNKLDMIIFWDRDVTEWAIDRDTTQENKKKVHTIDGFRGFLKSRLEKFKGIHSQTCYLHIKESEFRYNNEKEKLYHLILKIIRKKPLFSQEG